MGLTSSTLPTDTQALDRLYPFPQECSLPLNLPESSQWKWQAIGTQREPKAEERTAFPETLSNQTKKEPH